MKENASVSSIYPVYVVDTVHEDVKEYGVRYGYLRAQSKVLLV